MQDKVPFRDDEREERFLDKVPFRTEGEFEQETCKKTGILIVKQVLNRCSQKLVDSSDSVLVSCFVDSTILERTSVSS